MQFHVNCSLPRARSELLQCLLRQHPQIFASATSPLCHMWRGASDALRNPASLIHGKQKQIESIQSGLKGLTEGYYSTFTDSPVVIDKGRDWYGHIHTLWQVYPDARVLCMVRPVEEIIDSMERLYQKNTMHPDFAQAPLNIQKRIEYWHARPPLQQALAGLNYMQQFKDDRIIYIPSQALVNDPVGIMHQVFNHLELDDYDIDPQNITKDYDEFDGLFGPLGDHNVKPTIN